MNKTLDNLAVFLNFSKTFIKPLKFVIDMRKLILIILIAIIAILMSSSVLSLDKLTGYVNDEAGVISPSYEQMLNAELDDLKANTSVEMAVATVKTTGDIPIGEYSINLAHNVLGDKEKDNGILIFLAVEDRAYRIEVGYGIEPIIPDLLASRIGNEVMGPSFAEGNYEKGLLDGVLAISSILKGDENWETQGTGKSNSGLSGEDKGKLAFFLFFIIIIIISNVSRAYKSTKKKMKDKKGKGEKFNSGDFMAAMIIASMFGRGGKGGFGGGGLGGGGFGGFGGGGFGGGGFSGRF